MYTYTEELERAYQQYKLTPENRSLEHAYMKLCERYGEIPKDIPKAYWNKYKLRKFHRYGNFYFTDSQYTEVKFLQDNFSLYPLSNLKTLKIYAKSHIENLKYFKSEWVEKLVVDDTGYNNLGGLDSELIKEMSLPNMTSIEMVTRYYYVRSLLQFILPFKFPSLQRIQIDDNHFQEFLLEVRREIILRDRQATSRRPVSYNRISSILKPLCEVYPNIAINNQRLIEHELIRRIL